MVGQHGLNLAVGIITDHFGDIVAKVCNCLLQRGSLSLQEIVRDTGFSQSQAKNCLLVLIQHNCVQAYSIPRPAAGGALPKAVTQYMALFDNILHRMRFSKFQAIVAEDLNDAQCETLLEGLLQHGRLTFELLLQRANSKPAEGKTIDRDALCVSLDKLVQAHYVERCPRSEPFISPPAENESASTRKRGAKSAAEIETIEQQALTASALLDAERFSGLCDIGDDSSLEEATNSSLGMKAGEKRKHEAFVIDKDTQATINEKEVLWRANFEKFVHCLKKKACVANVRATRSLDAAVVLEAMIESSGRQNLKENSVTSSLDNMLEWLRKKRGGHLMTMQHVRAFLEELGCRSWTEELKTLYTIDLWSFIEASQHEEVELLVLQRYGKEAYRIFRLLVKTGKPVETDRISDITFVEKKEAQGILYKLWRDNYLQMEKMVSYNPGQHLLLWKVKTKSFYDHILNDMHHAALNLSQRIAQCAEQEHEVASQPVNESQTKKLEHIKKRRRILETSLLKLDDSLMLFHDF